MPELHLDPNYIARLIVKMRGIQGREALTDVDSGSNAIDDDMIDTLQDTPGDLTREEAREELEGLGPREQAELVALMWTGRGDAEPEEWQRTVELAAGRQEAPAPNYLLSQPLVGEYLAEGLERLGIKVPLGAAPRA